MSSKPGRSARLPNLGVVAKHAAMRTPDLLEPGKTPREAGPMADLLYARSLQHQPATNMGRRHLVTVHPRSVTPADKIACGYSEERSKECADAFLVQAPDYGRHDQDASLFHTVGAAYSHMLRDQQDQSLVLCGDACSGKSEAFRWILRHLCDLTKTSSKKTKFQSLILKASVVLAAFGNASTAHGPNSTCHLQYQELQFSEAGKMVGLKLVYTLLEASRASGTGKEGNNFHIFYHMTEGLPPAELEALHLPTQTSTQQPQPQGFHCLPTSGIPYPGNHGFELEELVENMKALGFGKRNIAQIWRLLAGILHLGNVEFVEAKAKASSRPCTIRNPEVLTRAAELLDVDYDDLAEVLTVKSQNGPLDSRVSIFLTPAGAAGHRDKLIESLYASLFHWVVEQINANLCQPEGSKDWLNYIAILEVPGFVGSEGAALGTAHRGGGSGYHHFLRNLINEQILAFRNQVVAAQCEVAEDEKTANLLRGGRQAQLLDTLLGAGQGILSLLNQGTASWDEEAVALKRVCAAHAGSTGFEVLAERMVPTTPSPRFAIQHSFGRVPYDLTGYMQADESTFSTEFYTLFRGSSSRPGSRSIFLQNLFSPRLLATDSSAKDREVVVATAAIMRKPSVSRKKRDQEVERGRKLEGTTGQQTRTMLGDILSSMQETDCWFLYFLRSTPNPSGQGAVHMDLLRGQVEAFDLPTCAGAQALQYVQWLPFDECKARYGGITAVASTASAKVDSRKWCEQLLQANKWGEREARLGSRNVFLSEGAWRALQEEVNQPTSKGGALLTPSDAPDLYLDDNASHYDSDIGLDEMVGRRGNFLPVVISDMKSPVSGNPPALPKGGKAGAGGKKGADKPKAKMTRMRVCWLSVVWALTFCLPTFPFLWGFKDPGRRMAWREKLAIFVLIILVNALVIFVIVGIGLLVCPRQPQLSPGELSGFSNPSGDPKVFMYGRFYNLNVDFIKDHANKGYPPLGLPAWQNQILGLDVSQMFPKDPNRACGDGNGPFYSSQPPRFPVTDPKLNSGPQSPWYAHGTEVLGSLVKYAKGDVVWTRGTLSEKQGSGNTGFRYVVIRSSRVDNIYDVGSMFATETAASNFFMGPDLYAVFSDVGARSPGADITSSFNALYKRDPQAWQKAIKCLNNLYYVGRIDHRNDIECQIQSGLLVAASIILLLVIVVKFFAALDFSSSKKPALAEKFVIMQVPCYTEGESSIRRTLDTLAITEYHDKFKLLFVICDGMVTGSGNSKATPLIVLDILGADPNEVPQSLAFESCGEGNKRLNYGKLYTGLYEIEGRSVPYVVLVKVGQPSESMKPGNRGKRDSQLVLMRFLSKVTLNQPMSPLELEMYHKMKHVIGVNPALYEHVLMVDADTSVDPQSVNILVASMAQDARILGICGETKVFNERKSWCTMSQVYEYYISHHLAKAFESFFGSVTCLPGCFSLYRIRTAKGVPLLTDPKLITAYAQNNVNTLHLKNLLHLGEDRYLTTLMIKHFPKMRNVFNRAAVAFTVVPDTWSVLFSQRRRWINSTIHNLCELLLLPNLCGFCLFNMRFVVFIDLFGTVTGISSFAYLGYLIYAVITDPTFQFPLISIIIIAAAYGLQLLILLVNMQWQHLGWFFFYLLAYPIFSVILPLYSFWNMDEFSWGNTRKIEGEQKAKAKDMAEEEFDPASIPLKLYSDYERELSDRIESVSTYSGMPLGAYSGAIHGPPSYYAPSDAGLPLGPHVGAQRNSMFLLGDGHSVCGASALLAAPDPANLRLGEPTNEQLLQEVRHILSTSNLMTVTKKDVRLQLSGHFGMDLTSRRAYINACIDRVLKGEL